ncbi:YceI family protein [Sphaerisporangium sp. B11E5]|uniref:YceI family protein n=1 Tax=Sphaerisporangium sp. B11E5 TaxID=3153563 RepID=UPI00325CCA17
MARRHRVGPDRGTLLLRTSRQGVAAQAGHDLTIEVTRWSGEVIEDGGTAELRVTAETASLRVLSGTGGVTTLTDSDRREIERNARRLLDCDRHPEAVFTMGGGDPGTLTLRGRSGPFTLTVTPLGGGRYRGTGTVRQSDYGIKPYTAFLGMLKVADPVEVEAEVELTSDEE